MKMAATTQPAPALVMPMMSPASSLKQDSLARSQLRLMRDALSADAGSATNHAQRYSNCLRYNGQILILLLSHAMLQVNENLKLRDVMFLQ